MTPIEIVNIGIEALGERPIQSFEDGSVAATAARATFHSALASVLERDVWNDATARVMLAAAVEAPAFGYARKYYLPGDCLRARDLVGCRLPWRREGRLLLTDAEPPVKLLYTRHLGLTAAGAPVSDGTDIQIGGLLATAVAFRWAWGAAKRITDSDASMQNAHELYRRALIEAAAADAAECTIEPAEVGSWVDRYAPESWVR